MSARIVWDDLADLVAWAGVPVVVKGVLDGRDARRGSRRARPASWYRTTAAGCSTA